MNIDKLLEHQKKLSHLSRSEVDMLLKRYGDGDKCSVLIDEYKIDITASQLSKTFPFVIAADERCPNCNTDMLRKYPTKSDIQYNYGRKKEAFCRTCEHRVQAYGRACNCQKCKDVKLLEVLKKQNAEKESRLNRMEIIFEEYKNNITHFDINEYSIKERLYISALLRATLDETMLEIGPISKYLDNFAPTAEYKNKIIYQLKESSKILFSPHSPPESIIEINDGISKYYPFRSMYRINAMLDEYKESIESLISVNDIIDKVDIETKKELWMEIGLYECLEFLYTKMNEFNMPVDNIGDKTIFSIKESLQSFSIAQVFNFIWGSVNSAAAFSKKSGISTKHSVNTIAGSILKRKEKAEIEGWEVKNYGRDYDNPQTKISELFFNSLLGIGNDGFTKPMHIIL